MAKPGRPTRQTPALLYNFRRGKLLVDILAITQGAEQRQALEDAARKWDVKDEAGRKIEHLPHGDLIEAIAKHCLQHLKEQQRVSEG